MRPELDRTIDDALRAAVAGRRREADTAIEAALRDLAGPEPILEAMRYAVEGGGKRIRPILVLSTCAACGGSQGDAHAFAAAIEFVHAYSLVHDDLPAMDNDLERRGAPTVHVRYGVANAILAGDALLTEAFAVAARASLPPNAVIAGVRQLARAAGAAGMVGGQALDMGGDLSTAEALLQMHALKTGALFRAACALGAIAAGAASPVIEVVSVLGDALGVAFQLSDDLLDLLEPAADPVHEAAVNVASRLGVPVALARVDEATARARAALGSLPVGSREIEEIVAWTSARSRLAAGALPP